jgi:hypothetical protein
MGYGTVGGFIGCMTFVVIVLALLLFLLYVGSQTGGDV